MADKVENYWESRFSDAAYQFGLHCAELTTQCPHDTRGATPLEILLTNLMTELWDRNFSQSEIRKAFLGAIEDMPRYANGEERRVPQSSEIGDKDWQNTK